MILIKKILILLLAAIMIVALVGCKQVEQSSTISNNTDSASEETPYSTYKNLPKDKYAYSEELGYVRPILIFEIPNDYVKPEYNKNIIATEEADSATFRNVYSDVSDFWIAHTGFSNLLEKKMKEYKNQNAWFRVIIRVWYDGEDQGYTRDDTLNYIKDLGATEIKQIEFSDCYTRSTDYVTELTAEMLNLLNDLGNCEIMLAQYPRNPEYSAVISDTMSIRLDKMTESDTVEVIAACVADKNNRYAEYQKVTVNNSYNSERFKPFTELANITYAEYNERIDKYLLDIAVRNDISEKIVISDDLPKVKKQSSEWRVTDDDLTEFCVGFNAVLTKAEILRLAEDEEIKVIYLAPQ